MLPLFSNLCNLCHLLTCKAFCIYGASQKEGCFIDLLNKMGLTPDATPNDPNRSALETWLEEKAYKHIG